jgi:hypothetical protein
MKKLSKSVKQNVKRKNRLSGAGEGIRTLDSLLGRQELYH